MSIILRRNWIGFSSFSILFLSLLILPPRKAFSQSLSPSLVQLKPAQNLSGILMDNFGQDSTENRPNVELPDPKSVMYKSMIIPGWGQIVNRQAWKVPIVYGLLGGLTYYSIYLTQKYHDYRAAYYNLNPQQPNKDFRFGPTPSYISEDANLNQLKSIRNTYRNRRDLVYVGIVLAYGLNIIDAYVFAHMRSFDVSRDLSVRTRVQPGITDQAAPGLTLSIDFITK